MEAHPPPSRSTAPGSTARMSPSSKPKLAVVAYPIGRIGSSALMGLLKVSGLNVGRESELIPAAAMNPKGFFELKPQQRLLCEAYRGFYPEPVPPPAIARADEIGAAFSRRYRQLLETEFEDRFPAAIKSQRCLTLPFLERMRDRYDIRVLLLERNEADHIRSTLRVWNTLPDADPVRRNASPEFVRDWIRQWSGFTGEVLKRCRFPALPVSFDQLIAAPHATAAAVFRFLEIEPPPEEPIAAWIDRSLVNREKP
jgi:hypothetical protein